MSSHYKIEIHRNAKCWATVLVDLPSPADVLADIETRFPADEGYVLTTYRARAERRILDSRDGVISVIASQFEYALVEDTR